MLSPLACSPGGLLPEAGRSEQLPLPLWGSLASKPKTVAGPYRCPSRSQGASTLSPGCSEYCAGGENWMTSSPKTTLCRGAGSSGPVTRGASNSTSRAPCLSSCGQESTQNTIGSEEVPQGAHGSPQPRLKPDPGAPHTRRRFREGTGTCTPVVTETTCLWSSLYLSSVIKAIGSPSCQDPRASSISKSPQPARPLRCWVSNGETWLIGCTSGEKQMELGSREGQTLKTSRKMLHRQVCV